MPKRAVANGITANETYANAKGEGRFTGVTPLVFSVMIYPVKFIVWLYETSHTIRLYPTSGRVRLRED
jgi:hypothetical protein